MSNLLELKVVHAKAGEGATASDIAAYHAQVPDWHITEYQGMTVLEREFKFRNFAQALAFTNQVGTLAEAEDHHPAILTEWGKVTVRFWTHTVGGLHANDFILAAKTDQLMPAG